MTRSIARSQERAFFERPVGRAAGWGGRRRRSLTAAPVWRSALSKSSTARSVPPGRAEALIGYYAHFNEIPRGRSKLVRFLRSGLIIADEDAAPRDRKSATEAVGGLGFSPDLSQ